MDVPLEDISPQALHLSRDVEPLQRLILDNQIRLRSYEKWLQLGRPPGTQLENWLEAEAELAELKELLAELIKRAQAPAWQLLASILDNANAAIFIKDEHGKYLLVNRWFEERFQLSEQELLGRDDFDLFPREVAEAFRGHDLQVLTGAMPLQFEERIPSGDEMHTYASIKFPVFGAEGRPCGVGGIATDITDSIRLRKHVLTHHAVTQVLANSATLADAAPAVLQRMNESLNWEVGVLWTVDPRVWQLRCVAYWQNPALADESFRVACEQASYSRGEGLPGIVWATGEHMVLTDATDPPGQCRVAAAQKLSLHAAVAVPVLSRTQVFGVLELFSCLPREPSVSELQLIESTAIQLGQFVERREAERRAGQHERELELARRIQRGLWPQVSPELAGYDIAGGCRPAGETGGDYFDFISTPQGELVLAVGDASGHGIGPALLITETHAFVRALALTQHGLDRILQLTNRHLADEVEFQFVTLFLACINPERSTIRYSNAGHVPALVLDKHGSVKHVLQNQCFPLGLFPEAEFAQIADISLEPGQIMVLLTDGTIDACSTSGIPFGFEGVMHAIRKHAHESSQAIVDAVFDAVWQYSDKTSNDDMTVVIVKRDER